MPVFKPILKVAVITLLGCENEFIWKDEDLLEGEFLILFKEEVAEEDSEENDLEEISEEESFEETED